MAEESLPEATVDEIALYHHCTRLLPGVQGFSGTGFDAKGRAIPYGVGPHSIQPIREALNIVRPERILEIGFAQGYSASIFLEIAKSDVTSVDISDREETAEAGKILTERYPGKFRLIIASSACCAALVSDRKYDMIFIDGGHLEADVECDIHLGIHLGIPWFFFDDWQHRFGPGVQPAISKAPIEITNIWWNMALGRPK